MKTKSKFDLIFKIIVATVLVIYAITMIFLVLWGLMNSFKALDDFRYFGGAMSLPKPIEGFEQDFYDALKFGNYKVILENFHCNKSADYFTIFNDKTPVGISTGEIGIPGLLLNTIYLAGVCSFAQVFVCYTTSYLAAKYKFRFSKFLYGMVIVAMTIPLVGTQPATIDLLQKLNLYGRHIGMLMMRASYSGMYFLVFYAFFEGLPDSYTEAAEIDGASQLSIFVRIIIPLGIKTIGTITLILFVANWNDYSISYIYMPTVPTLALGIYEIAHLGYEHPHLDGIVYKIAGCMLLVVPITIIFIFAKDKLMGNISAGGLKG